MDFTTCTVCDRKVLPSSDGTCPSCGCRVTDAPEREATDNPFRAEINGETQETGSDSGTTSPKKSLLSTRGIGQVLLVLTVFYFVVAFLSGGQMNANERAGALSLPIVCAVLGALLVFLGKKK